ncbi:helix-turn-helix domain-containing protein, partial [Kaarinaea lacus]
VLLGAGLGLFLAIALLVIQNGNQFANRMLALLTLVCVVELADTFLYHTHFYTKATYLIGVENPLDLLYGPLVFLYIVALTSPSKALIATKLCRHFLPFIIGFTLMIPFFLLDSEVKLNLLFGETEPVSADLMSADVLIALFGFFIVALVAIVQMGIYLVLAIRRLYRHARDIQDQFSYTERVSLVWARNLLIILSGLYITYIIQTLYFYFTPEQDTVEFISDILMLMIVIMIYVMGFLGLRQPAIFSRLETTSQDRLPDAINHLSLLELSPETRAEKKYKKSALDESMSDALLEDLLHHMEQKKPYLNGELTLPQLAAELGISPHYLSQVINERLKQNFFDFVNRYRVEEVKQCLSDPTNNRGNIATLAFDAGFNSKSAFYTAFKKLTGMTPKQFKESLDVSLTPTATEPGKY